MDIIFTILTVVIVMFLLGVAFKLSLKLLSIIIKGIIFLIKLPFLIVLYPFKLLFGGGDSSTDSKIIPTVSNSSSYKNRCFGCSSYDSIHPYHLNKVRCSDDSIQCPVGGTVSIGKGCQSFTPDITACCSQNCWNWKGSDDIYDICTKHGKLLEEKTYCQDYIHRES